MRGAPGEGGVEWALHLAGDGEAAARAVAALPSGGAVVVGGFGGALEAAGARLESAGAGDGFAVATGPDGRIAWTVQLGGPHGEELGAAAAGPGGSVAVGGLAGPGAELAGAALTGPGEPLAVVARLEPDGRPGWIRAIAASGYAVTTAVAWTAEGDVLAAGYYAGTLEPDGAALHGAGAYDLWVARLRGADGAIVWMHRGGGPGADAAFAVAPGPDGGAWIGGSFARWADLGSARLVTLDEPGDAFIAAVDAGGFRGARSLPTEGTSVTRHLAAVPGGGLVAAVEFDGDLMAGGTRVSAAGAGDVLIARLAADGALAWTRALVGPEIEASSGLSVQGGRLLVAGAFQDELRVADRPALPARGGRDVYLAAFDLAGSPAVLRALGGGGDETPTASAATDQAWFIAGSSADSIELGSLRTSVEGRSDAFLIRVALPR